MAPGIALKTAQRQALLHSYRRHPDPAVRLRAQIILLLADGHPWSLITAADAMLPPLATTFGV
jgi:hypothetical protein